MPGLLNWFRKGTAAARFPIESALPACRPQPTLLEADELESSDDPVLQARNLVRSFGDADSRTIAVSDVSFDLYPGQLGLLMGPSGSGKSTLLALLSGLLRPDSGRVHVLGQDLWSLTERQQEQFRLRHFGFIFQGYNLFPALTARQQLEMVLRWGEGIPAREAAIRSDALLAQLGLAKKRNLRPAQLSGGEKQRVAIGRALIKHPEFCFADEPTSALDWEHGEQIIRLLRQITRQQRAAVVVVSHDTRLLPFADRVFHLADGCLSEPSHDPLGDRESLLQSA